MKKLSLILMFLVSAMVCGAQDFQSGDLLYEIISDNPPEVSLFGHVDGQDAQGELNIPATVQFEGVDYTVAELSWYAFNECHGLTGTLVIPNTVRVIGEYAFYECDGLSGPLVFPESVIEVKVGAFCHCTGFTGTLTFPDSMTKVGDGRFNYNLADGGAFQGCLGFNRLELPASLQFIGVETFADCANLTGQLILPEGVTTIECNAFENCTGFTGTLVIPESVETVEGEVFKGCTGIENLVLPNHFIFFYYTAGNNMTSSYDNFSGCDGLTHVEIPEGWERTGFNVFTNCANLTSVHLPESLSIIDNSCFYNCTSLTEINFPEGLVRIGTDAFHGCTSLSGVSLPNSLIELCIGAFNGCTGLTGDLVIPDLVEDVMLRTFENCTGLNRVILGASVKLVYESAFNDTQLESLFFKATTPPQLERFNYPTNQVWDFPADLPIIVPCGTLEAYQNAEGWNEFTNMSSNCLDITAAVIPDNSGIVTGAGTYDMFTTCTLTAISNEGYTFLYWTEDETVVSTDATYSFVVTEDRNLVANFTINTYNLTVAANPAEGGTVTGEGTYDHGTSVTIAATANDGYTFVNWAEGDVEVSTDASYTFTITDDHDFIANFTIKTYDVTVAANPAEGGTVTGEGTYDYGTSVTIAATVNVGYTFNNWTEDGEMVSTDESFTFTIADDHDFVANFTLNTYDVTVTANPIEGGAVTGEGTYDHGSSVTVTATAN